MDVYIDPNDWNDKLRKVKPHAPNASLINSYITQKEAEAEAIALELEIQSKFVTAYDIKARIIGDIPKDFFEYMQNRIEAPSEELLLLLAWYPFGRLPL